MASEKTVLVFGATGQQGGAVARALKGAGFGVRAFVRDPGAARARALQAIGIDLQKGDFSDRASVEQAMAGAYGVFSVQPSSGQGPIHGISDEQELSYGRALADSAVKQGVQQFVYTSVGAAGKGETGLGHFDSKTKIEAYIRSLDLNSTILRPAAFMEMLMLPGMGLDRGCFTFLMRPDQSMQLIAVDDIGKIAASLFADPARYGRRTIEIAGDQLTGKDLAQRFGAASGRPIAYHRFPDSLLRENRFLGRLAELVDDGRCAGAADIPALKREFGDLLSLEQWLAGAGRESFAAALTAQEATVALR